MLMSLRFRLTFLYILILTGILLFFGTAIYLAVSFTMIDQVDARLADITEQRIIPNITLKEGGLSVSPEITRSLNAQVYWQIWSLNGKRVTGSTTSQPLDPRAVTSTVRVRRDTYFMNIHMRVYSEPLTVGRRYIGTLQVASEITIVDHTLENLLVILGVGALVAITIAGLAAWVSTYRALAPIKDVTQAALQITRADDLSRRIPYLGPEENEIGQLVRAFNQTLGRLENLFSAQRRFMADVGHELRTPLTVIKGNVGLMRRMGVDEESLGGIESEVDRLTRLVGDLLLLAQAEVGKLPLDRRTVELDTLLLEAMQQMSVLARDKLRMRIGDIDQVLVCGDKDRLKQVIVNLIGNAISYTPSGGEVVVSVGKMGNQARLIVSDNGPGIPAEDLSHIFERFYRGQKSRTRSRDGKGFGLGLSIAYWIVRHHDGRIEVDSTEGKGTTFCVWLPLAPQNCQS